VLGLEAEDEPVGAEGVLDGEGLTQELRVPGPFDRVPAGANSCSRSRTRGAVPTGTVDFTAMTAGFFRRGANWRTAVNRWDRS
jgi:hypothetical protein